MSQNRILNCIWPWSKFSRFEKQYNKIKNDSALIIRNLRNELDKTKDLSLDLELLNKQYNAMVRASLILSKQLVFLQSQRRHQ